MRTVTVFAALIFAVLAGAPALAEEAADDARTTRACPDQPEAGAACPLPAQQAERRLRVTDREVDVKPASGTPALPIYIPPSRGTTTVRVGGGTRGGDHGPESL